MYAAGLSGHVLPAPHPSLPQTTVPKKGGPFHIFSHPRSWPCLLPSRCLLRVEVLTPSTWEVTVFTDGRDPVRSLGERSPNPIQLASLLKRENVDADRHPGRMRWENAGREREMLLQAKEPQGCQQTPKAKRAWDSFSLTVPGRANPAHP